MAQAAYDEMRRLIREEEPPRPSQRLSTLETLPSVAACRKTEPAKLSRMMKGELDWVVMKALEKDRTRRYETANALARIFALSGGRSGRSPAGVERLPAAQIRA